MSDTKPTPGPWSAERRAGTWSYEVRTREALIGVVGNLGATSDHAPTAKRWRGETLANARLIAAAPDMLAALLSTRASLQAMADEGIVAQDSWPTIDAAIAKATGA